MSIAVTESSSTGLPSRTAAALAYGGWWLTGALFWLVERRDAYVRFHAAQSLAAFGLLAVLLTVLGVLAAVALSFQPRAFTPLMWAAGLTWAAGVALWLWAMWKAASGDAWRIPLASHLADRLVAYGLPADGERR
jgi:uncharacterized membrane protein